MKEILEKLKMTKELLTIIVGFIGIIIAGYSFLSSINNKLAAIEKTTLRTMIWSYGIPKRDKIDSCDEYIKKGYNSETKKYCEKLLEQEFNDLQSAK